MKKVLAIILAAIMLLTAVAFTGCTQKDKTNATQTVFKPTGESKGTLKLGFDAEYPPYGYLDTDTNQYAGFDIEYAKAVCEDISYTLELVPINWDFKDTELQSGNIDCIWSGFTIQGREKDYEWTTSYSDSSIVILTKKGSGITDKATLQGKIVTVQKESSGQEALDGDADLVATFKGGKYETCGDYTSAFADLKTGAVEAIIIDIGVAKSLIANETDYVILDDKISVENYGVGFLKGNTELCKLINDSMIKLEGTAKTIAAKYELEDSINIVK